MIDQLQTALDWHNAGRAVALATVVDTWGSAPRPTGSQLVIDARGEFEGSVSGGCVEGAVVAEAMDAITAGKPKLLTYGVADETAWEVGLACGGRIKILVEPVGAVRDPVLMAQIIEQVAARRPVTVAIRIDDGVSWLLGAGEAGSALGEAAAKLAQADRSGIAQTPEGAFFLCIYNPGLRMTIIGAVHIAQALVPLARQVGFEVTVVDPRAAFASPARFPGVALMPIWPDEALATRPPDARTAMVALTHDPKIDDPALSLALRSRCFYIGALGSKKTHAARIARLEEAGFGSVDLARLHAPIGLAIGARSPAEIAVAIVAQIIGQLRGKGGAQ
ncbi:MAG: XdhC family protein [Alphaproteobacteria bacterium]